MLQRWTQEDYAAFIASVKEFGEDWRKITESIKTKSRNQVRNLAFQIQKFKEFAKSKFKKEKSPEEIKLLLDDLKKKLLQTEENEDDNQEIEKPKRRQQWWTKEDYDTLIKGIERHGIDDYHALWIPLQHKFHKNDIGRKVRENKFLFDKRCIGKFTWKTIRP